MLDRERLLGVLRKEWVRFVRLSSKEACEAAVKQYLNSNKASLLDFNDLTGTDILTLQGSYLEYCGDEAPIAPVVAGTIEPIISFRQEEGKVVTIRLGLEGLYHISKEVAWVRTAIWEEIMGDQTYLEDNLESIVFPTVATNPHAQELPLHATETPKAPKE